MMYVTQIHKEMETLIESVTLTHNFKRLLQDCLVRKLSTEYDFSFGSVCIMHFKELANYDSEEIFTIAAALELLILSGDLLDDVQDRDSDDKWNATYDELLCASLAFLSLYNAVLVQSSFVYKNEALQHTTQLLLQSINGQYLDVGTANMTEEQYLTMTEKKSGALFNLSCQLGTVLATGNMCATVTEYALCFGIIQQINNDLHDLLPSNAKNDLVNRKLSLPILYLLRDNNKETAAIREYYRNLELSHFPISDYASTIVDSGAIHYANAIKYMYKQKGLLALHKQQFQSQHTSYLNKLLE